MASNKLVLMTIWPRFCPFWVPHALFFIDAFRVSQTDENPTDLLMNFRACGIFRPDAIFPLENSSDNDDDVSSACFSHEAAAAAGER